MKSTEHVGMMDTELPRFPVLKCHSKLGIQKRKLWLLNAVNASLQNVNQKARNGMAKVVNEQSKVALHGLRWLHRVIIYDMARATAIF